MSKMNPTWAPKTRGEFCPPYIGPQPPLENRFGLLKVTYQHPLSVPKNGSTVSIRVQNEGRRRLVVQLQCSEIGMYSFNPQEFFLEPSNVKEVFIHRSVGPIEPARLRLAYGDAPAGMSDAKRAAETIELISTNSIPLLTTS